MSGFMRTRTHEMISRRAAGSHLTSHDPAFEIVFRELPCNCGAAHGRTHTVHEGNPTGHSVGCPVFLRWAAADAAIAFAEALQAIILHAGTVGVVQDEHSTIPTAEEELANVVICAERVLAENTGWLESIPSV